MINLVLNPKSKLPIYAQLVQYFKKEIRCGHLQPQDKLPSIRSLQQELSLSRSTIYTAYDILVAEDYIVSRPKSGFTVAGHDTTTSLSQCAAALQQPYYNFSNNYVDSSTFNIQMWQRCTKKVITDAQVLAAYGEPQGELPLRQALVSYSYKARGVACLAEQIVIGAATQSLLSILLACWPAERGKHVMLEEPGFPQAEAVFRNFGWRISYFEAEQLPATPPSLLLISTSNPYKGRSLTTEQKQALVAYAHKQNCYIIEDDYNGEFRYFTQSASTLYGLSRDDKVIYLGSFSRLLIPSLRISYMILPPLLQGLYQAQAQLYTQTSSTIEQLTLAHYITTKGCLDSHVRKLRQTYARKNRILTTNLKKIFGTKVTLLGHISGLHLRLALHYPLTATALARRAESKGVKLLPLQTGSEAPEVVLSIAGIDSKDIRKGLLALKAALEA